LSGEKTIKNDFGFDREKPVSSTIDVSLHTVNGASKVVAAGTSDSLFSVKIGEPNSLKALSEQGLELYACVDNDEAGIKFTRSNGLIPCNRILAENSVKDFNELLHTIERNRAAVKNRQSVQAAEKSPTSKIEALRTTHKRR